MPVSKAQQAATARYVTKHYDRIEIKVSKTHRYKEQIQAAAEAAGISPTEFICRALDKVLDK